MWLEQSATSFALPDTALPDNGSAHSLRHGVPLPDWRKIAAALDHAAKHLPRAADAPVERWIAAIGAALKLDPLATRILALALQYKLDQRVERLVDTISDCRDGPTSL